VEAFGDELLPPVECLRAQQETGDPAERVVTMDELTMRLELPLTGTSSMILMEGTPCPGHGGQAPFHRRLNLWTLSGRRDPRAGGVKDLCPNIFPLPANALIDSSRNRKI